MTWPAPGRASVSLGAAAPFRSSYTGPLSGALNSVTSRAGSLPVWVSGPAANTVVAVSMASHRAARAAGVKGVVLDLAGRTAATVSVRLDYAAFSGAYGGDWAARLRLVEMPACALTTPARAACRRQTPVPGVNDPASQSLRASVRLGSAPVILATTATTGGAEGDYQATSLKPSGTWAVQQGDFTYKYPIDVPPALGGTAPSVVLGYDSQSIDSETSGTNTQSSWIGDGWDYSPGYIERSYQPCSQDGVSGSGDECWGGYNATLALPGHSSVIIRDDANGTWHLRNDDGTSVEELHGASNGVWNGEYWLVTTPDGTKYYFGLNHLPGGNGSDAATNSAWGEPVYNPNSGDPCYSSSDGSSSQCQMGYRWNLDYVVDPHNNLTVYDYATETNYYERAGNTLTEYVRGGYPTSISYGYQLSDAVAGARAPAQVIFSTSQRCLPTSTFTDCSYGNLSSSTASNWPDTPYDLHCGSSGSCSTTSPTFWSTVRLTSITTQVLKGSSYQQVDSYALTQSFPDASGASQPVMFLSSIQHTGEDGTAVSLPAETFTPTEIDNRVDGLTPAAEPLYRPRISTIATEYGSDVAVTYAAPACSRVNNTMPSAADTNTMSCFPVYWTPAGEVSPILDWFNKTLVSSVSTADETKAGSPVQVTSYQYVGGAAWHQDESPIPDPKNRTWDQYRGYAKVIVTTGASPDPITETETTYMRGMDGDPRSGGGTSSASVADSLGGSITDSDWLAGQVLETDTYTAAGGTVDSKTVNGPWTFTSTGSQVMPNGLAAMTAEMTSSEQTRSLALLASGSWRTTTTDTSYNSNAQPVQVDAKGDGSSSDPEICTTTAYASSSSNPMMDTYASEVKAIAGPCGTKPTASNTVSDTRTFYDKSATLGAIPGPGDVTSSQVISGYDGSGNPQFMTRSSATYDKYGRAVTTTNAKGYTTQTAYTPATGALPTQTVVTNPMGWKTTTTYDPTRGLPLTVTDANGNVTTEAYDALGRVTGVWLPGRSTALSANDTFSYNVSDAAPTYVTTRTLREDGTYATSVKIYDGLLQLREVQETPANGAAGRLISDTFYDSHGWVAKTSSPYYDQTTSPDGVLSPAADQSVPSQTVTQYDGQGRVVASQFYSLGTQQWQTATSYPGMDETSVDPPAGGTATTTFTNALGETTAQWSYSGSATATGKQSDAVDTSYTYTPAGQVASISDNAGNKWTYTYNLLGEKVSQTDPDSGTTTFGYDPNGNLTSTTDARQQVLSYTYDQVDRKTAEYSGSVATGTELASWAYDSLAKGQVTSSTAYINGSAYTEAITGYNTAYQPTGTSLTIPSAEGKLAGTYTTGSTYSPVTGELTATTYSGDGGLPSETVHYTYDEEGLLSTFRGQTSYLDSAVYSPLGQVLRTSTGPYGAQLAVTSAYDAGTGRALQTTDNVQVGSAAVDTTSYTYARAGNLTSVSDAQAGGSTDTQCFSYNHLSQLTAAWSDTGGTSTAAAPSVSGIGGCDTTAPTASNIGGPAPYWETWSYDPLGDRSSQTSYSPSGTVTQTLSYPGGNGTSAASQANSVSSVKTATSSGSASTTYKYNATGDTTSETSSTGATESFGYTPQDQVQTATTSSGTSTYLYDADGNLLLQKDPGSATLYLDNGTEELTLSTSANTVSGTRYYSEPDGTTIVRSSSGAINYELANQQGTNLEIVNATTDGVTRRYYDPYGDHRGTAAAGWVDNRGFLNQPTDSTTGLDLLGTRQYDPVTGRFLQVDSTLETGDTRQMGGYAYAADDPVNGSDPTGNDCWGPGGENIPCGGSSGGGGSGGSGGSGGGGGCWGPGGEWLCGDSGGNTYNSGGSSGSGSGGSSGCWGPGGEYLCGSWNGNNGGQCWGPGGEWTCGNQPSAGDGGGLQWSGNHYIPWNPPKPKPVATRPADPYTCSRFGTGCNPVPVSSGGGGGGGGFFGFLRKAAHFVGQVTGVNQIINCVTTWTASSCTQAALAVGMDALTVVTDGGAEAAEMAMEGSVDLSSEVASQGADLAAEAGGDGIDGASSAGDSALACNANSFTGPTRVLLGNGTKTPIDKVKVGEKVLATDPYTGVTQPRPVMARIVHSGRHAMVTITLAGGARLTSTSHHLFWDASTGKFAYASSLRAGTRVLDGNGHQVRVIGTRDYTANLTAYNLAVDGVHTYYVEAGETSVLVHNGCIEGEVVTLIPEASPARFAVDSNGKIEDLMYPPELAGSPGPYETPTEGPMEMPESRAGRFLQALSGILSHDWHHSIFGH